jgi:type VI secretion system secreted protein VgrG
MAKLRAVAVDTVLGDALVFRHMQGREELNRPFVYDVALLSEDDGIDLDELLGTGVTLSLELGEGEKRHFHGLVSHAAFAGTEGSFARYDLRLAPWLWFLSRTNDCRIFQEMTAVEIIKEIFGKYPTAEHTDRLTRSYETREYCVQYRESDLDFVQRLMESEGIAYYFTHEDGKHTLILSDDGDGHDMAAGCDEVPYFPKDDLARRERDHVHGWRAWGDVQPGAYTHTAFDFKSPRADLQARLLDPMPHEQAEGEVYDYPGPHVALGHGEALARTRLEELLACHRRAEGLGTVQGLVAGQRFGLVQYPREDQNREYLVTQVGHELWADAYRSESSGGEGEVYLCRFEAMPSDRPFRPVRVTPVPVVKGPQTAIVTGPSGEEIWCDEHGRIKVQFHWDRLGKKDEHSSCWVRVSQLWAGGAWGGMHVPRIGQEVIVDFLEGDPDRPIVTGRVYNGVTTPPWGLPANATQSGIKSNSSKGGGGSNELRFEDKKGDEEIWIHAEKDENIVVENDKTENVGHDETIAIGNDRIEEVGHDETMSVGNDQTLSVGHDRVRSVGNDEDVTVGANQTVKVGKNRLDRVGGNEVRTVTRNQAQLVGANRNVTVASNQSHIVRKTRSARVGGEDKVTVDKDRTVAIKGKNGVTIGKARSTSVGEDDGLDVKKSLTINAGDQITIKTGSASIVMKKDGTITIEGKDITIKGSGKINVKADGKIIMKGDKIEQN